jgi:esterase/lipase superfamily enzyme
VTDRNDELKSKLEDRFGPRRYNPLSCGVLRHLPDTQRILGDVFQGHIRELPRDLPTGQQACLDLVTSEIKALEGSNDVYIFIHGYNTGFDWAVRRGIGIVEDINVPGLMIIWSWPSDENRMSYPYDEDSARSTVDHLTNFFDAFLDAKPNARLHLLSHSLGSRVALGLIRRLADSGRLKNLHSTVFAAPDEDQKIFEASVKTAFERGNKAGIVRDFTMYASSRDIALKVSEWVHKGKGEKIYYRAGSSGRDDSGSPIILLADSIESVDASNLWADDTYLHDYLFANPRGLIDLNKVIVQYLAASERGLQSVSVGPRKYWVLSE